MSLYTKTIIVAVLFTFTALTFGTVVFALQNEEEVPFLYPDPRTVGTHPYIMQGKPGVPMTPNRYAGISEQERLARMCRDLCCCEEHEHVPCPLCEESPKTPCGTCKMCEAGFPCEKTLCRHCVQPRSKNMGNSCDLTAGDEPCGTCDACREHRSDPCEHADNGYGPQGEFNPYKEPRLLSVIPRPVLDIYNNGARKFPVYYNPAPYYRPTWNPSLYAGYARPFTFRWSCALCYKNPCECDSPGLAGQISYAFACKFCNRNPCACAQDICDVNKPMDPAGIAHALTEMKEAANAQPEEIRETTTSSITSDLPTGISGTTTGGGIRVDDLFDDDLPVVPEPIDESTPRPRPRLDAPTPEALPSAGSNTVS